MRRPKSVNTIDSTGQGHFLTACFTSVLVCITNSYCISKLFFVLCVWQCSFSRITDKLLPFDLSILILDKLCMNLSS